MSAIREFWAANHEATRYEFTSNVSVSCKRLTCADGFNMSVQASYGHYCTPRTYLEDGSYTDWEVGYPTAADERLAPYAEDGGRLTDTVYGYVPTQVVDEVIAAHGGIVTATPAEVHP